VSNRDGRPGRLCFGTTGMNSFCANTRTARIFTVDYAMLWGRGGAGGNEGSARQGR
jgi:hypothetical protein